MQAQKTIPKLASFISRLLFRTRQTEVITEGLTVAGLEALSRYDGTLPYTDYRVRALVWEVKYYASRHAVEIAGEYLAQLLLAEAADVVGIPLLIPIPMHSARRKERGHNQTEILCESALNVIGSSEAARKKVLGGSQTIFASGFAYAPDALQRIKHTQPQQGLERHDRLKNVKDSMRVADPAKVTGRVCIVVDDVTTTGASFAEAKRALKEAGATEVRTIALAQS